LHPNVASVFGRSSQAHFSNGSDSRVQIRIGLFRLVVFLVLLVLLVPVLLVYRGHSRSGAVALADYLDLTGRLKFVLASDLSGIQIDESVVGADRFAVTGVITLGYLGSPASSHVGHSDGRISAM